MVMSVDWGAKFITIPKADTVLVQSSPVEVRDYDLNGFRLEVADLMDDGTGGMAYDTVFSNSPPFTVSGVELARVIEIINDYTLQFEDGTYQVNLLGANSNFSDRIVPNQVGIRTGNSAGLVTSAAIEFGEYGGGVTIDQTLTTTGTQYPTGTARQPVGNLADAVTILLARGFHIVYIVGDITLTGSDFSSGVKFIGQSEIKTHCTLDAGTNVNNCEFTNMTVTGVLDNTNVIRQCLIDTITSLDGFIEDCGVSGSITLGGTQQTEIINSFSNVVNGVPYISMGSGADLAIRNWTGGLEIRDHSGSNYCTVDMASGQLILAASLVSGTFTARGVAKLIDNSAGATVVNELLDSTKLPSQIWSELTTTPVAGSYGQTLQDIHGGVDRVVHINTEELTNGDGYQQSPFNNFSDGVDYAEANGLLTLEILADATVDRQLKNFEIQGIGNPVLDLNGQDMDGAIVQRCTITGAITGTMNVNECALVNTTNMAGVYLTVSIAGTISTQPGSDVIISRVAPALAGQPWTLNMNGGAASTVAVQNISGGVIITNMDHANDILHLGFSQGEVTLASTCTAGVITIFGNASVVDNSTGTTVNIVRNENYKDTPSLVWNAARATYTTAGSFGAFIQSNLLTVGKFLGLK